LLTEELDEFVTELFLIVAFHDRPPSGRSGSQ